MSLFTATLITAIVLLAFGVILFMDNPKVRDIAHSWPRSQNAAIVFMTIGGLWFLNHVFHLEKADFGDYKHYLMVGFAAVGVLSFKYLPDFLAVRGLGIIILLAAHEVLSSAYMQEPASRLWLVTFIYILIALTLYVGASPYRMRDFTNWLYDGHSRPKLLGGFLAIYGLILAGVAFNYS
jgi:hypothetical protein